jgi:type IV secretion system protein VirB2
MKMIKTIAASQRTKALIQVMLIIVLSVAMPAFAEANGYTDTKGSVCGFLGNINDILTMASIAVVTIAVIFAGYQIAFAHKRISDVAPILIGGLLIGAAGQIASMIMPDNAGNCMDDTGTVGSTIVVDPITWIR